MTIIPGKKISKEIGKPSTKACALVSYKAHISPQHTHFFVPRVKLSPLQKEELHLKNPQQSKVLTVCTLYPDIFNLTMERSAETN